MSLLTTNEEEKILEEKEEKQLNKPVNEEEQVENAAQEEERVEVKDNEEEVEKPTDEIQDLDLTETRKKRFRINGDNNSILEINTADMRILNRLEVAYKKLQNLAEEATEMLMSEEDEDIEHSTIGEKLDTIDSKMRKILDELFDTNVSEVCAPDGTMYDPYGGKFRFEYLIDVIGNLYEKNLTTEIKLMSKRMAKHTDKYTKRNR